MDRAQPIRSRRRLERPSLAIVLILVIAGGCSTSAVPAPAASAVPPAQGAAASAAAAATSATGKSASLKDPCSLLTPAEVGAAVGYSVAEGKLDATGNTCRWQGQSVIGAQLVVGTGGAPAFKTMAALPMTGRSQPISGIGDEAAQSNGTEAVVFRKGDTVVTIDAAQATTGAAAVLAKLVASRI